MSELKTYCRRCGAALITYHETVGHRPVNIEVEPCSICARDAALRAIDAYERRMARHWRRERDAANG
jgi:thymidine kinase